MMYTQNNPLQKKIILYNYCTPEIIYNWPHVALVAFIKHREKFQPITDCLIPLGLHAIFKTTNYKLSHAS